MKPASQPPADPQKPAAKAEKKKKKSKKGLIIGLSIGFVVLAAVAALILFLVIGAKNSPKGIIKTINSDALLTVEQYKKLPPSYRAQIHEILEEKGYTPEDMSSSELAEMTAVLLTGGDKSISYEITNYIEVTAAELKEWKNDWKEDYGETLQEVYYTEGYITIAEAGNTTSSDFFPDEASTRVVIVKIDGTYYWIPANN